MLAKQELIVRFGNSSTKLICVVLLEVNKVVFLKNSTFTIGVDTRDHHRHCATKKNACSSTFQ